MEETDNKDLTREQRLEIEQKAIEALISMGVKFKVRLRIEPKRPPYRILWWNKHFPDRVKIWRDKMLPKCWDVSIDTVPDAAQSKLIDVYVRNFHIKPLYLGTIDYLRKLYLQIEYDEEKIQDEPIQESKKLFKYIPLMADIAAIAVLNDPTITDPFCKKVKELKKFFMEYLTVDKLRQLSEVISQMMNPGGFTSSIRSIKEIGTTKPKQDKANLVE